MASVPNTTTFTSPHPKTFSVAIIGGGIGGLCLAIGLSKYPQIDSHVYESAPSFGEIGAGVALGPNGQRAMELIGPNAKEAFDRHATGNMWPSHANNFAVHIVGKGEHENELIHSQKNATGMQSVHRAHFLDELVKLVPAQRAHFNKRLISITDEPGKEVVMRFKDGTTAIADAVIGADGIHSAVREYLLGKEEGQAVFSGTVCYRGLVPMDAAVEKLGAEFAQNSTMICGPGKAILSYPIDHGATFNVAAMDYEHPHWEQEKAIVPAKREELDRLFQDWGTKTQHIVDLLDTPNLATWSIWEVPPISTYTQSRVCMLGDAAHATTPFQGQGAGQAIEDALVLSTLLSKINNPASEIPNAFTAYDQVRRPRSQRVVKTSREAGDLYGMKAPNVGDDLGKMAEAMATRMHWIWQRDMSAQNREAVELFEESL
ncbi:salicylate hydroxylase, partial [Lecanoromycetidae sp. Uapishka_2]